MSAPTPRTDAEAYFATNYGKPEIVSARFARQLERELRDERKMRDQAVANEAAMLIRLKNTEAERDKLREHIRLHAALATKEEI
jgi:hypothetical protein